MLALGLVAICFAILALTMATLMIWYELNRISYILQGRRP
jgi:hypothetical protein